MEKKGGCDLVIKNPSKSELENKGVVFCHSPRKSVRLDSESDHILVQMKMLSGTGRDILVNNAIKIAYGSIIQRDPKQMEMLQNVLKSVLSSFFQKEHL